MPKRKRHREAARRGLPAATSGGSSTTLGRVDGAEAAEALAEHLLDADRRLPVAVVSIASDRAEPWIDAEALAAAVGDLAEVVVLPTDASSWRLSEALPPLTQVYGGAGRVYPIGLAWTSNPFLSPLRFAYGAADGVAATKALISDALRMAYDAGAVRTPVAASPLVRGTVVALVPPSRGLVRLEDDSLATIWQELIAPEVPLPNLLAVGMKVEGRLEIGTGRLDVSGMVTEAPPLETWSVGDVVLTRVAAVRPDVAHLALHPGRVVAIPRTAVTSGAGDSLTSLLTTGEVVAARVSSVGDRLSLRLDDVAEGDAPGEAPPFLRGGPPWLVPPIVAPPEEPVTHPRGEPVQRPYGDHGERDVLDAETPRGATLSLSLSLEAARAQVAQLQRRLDDLQRRSPSDVAALVSTKGAMESLAREHRQLQTTVERERTRLRKLLHRSQRSARTESGAPRARLFLDPVDQLRHEIYVEWATRIPAEDKAQRPLRPYVVGPDFLPSLDRLDGVSREKVVQVTVEVLTGLAEQLAGRELHPLRTGVGGGDPQVRRTDGAACWRVALQRSTPGARRLHYWRRGDHFELSRVALHDDVRP